MASVGRFGAPIGPPWGAPGLPKGFQATKKSSPSLELVSSGRSTLTFDRTELQLKPTEPELPFTELSMDERGATQLNSM